MEKKAYIAPEVKVYGSVQDITHQTNKGNGAKDGFTVNNEPIGSGCTVCGTSVR